MRIAKNDVPVRLAVPGATARQKLDFGDATGFGKMSGEYFSFGAGTDITPLLHGLEGNLCQCPHWGYLLKGKLTTTDQRGARETVRGGDLFHWPPGHTGKAEQDSDFVMFSPQQEHAAVLAHIEKKTAG